MTEDFVDMVSTKNTSNLIIKNADYLFPVFMINPKASTSYVVIYMIFVTSVTTVYHLSDIII